MVSANSGRLESNRMNKRESSLMKNFGRLIQQTRKQAKKAGLKPSDINKAVIAVRRGK